MSQLASNSLANAAARARNDRNFFAEQVSR
jgi:hypothetical protein